MSNVPREPLTPREKQAVADFYADVSAAHIAGVYAQALLGATEQAGQTESVLSQLDALVTEILDQNSRIEPVLASAFVSEEDKTSILDRALGGRVSPLLLNFLKVLARHGRLDVLRPVHREAHREFDRLRGRLHVQLTTATEVDDALARRIVESLHGALPGEPILERVVNPEIIGGAIVRIGDTVYDGSLATQLGSLREKIVDRSVHEIQSRRDRFRTPAGD